jgi:hypothetical protein
VDFAASLVGQLRASRDASVDPLADNPELAARVQKAEVDWWSAFGPRPAAAARSDFAAGLGADSRTKLHRIYEGLTVILHYMHVSFARIYRGVLYKKKRDAVE